MKIEGAWLGIAISDFKICNMASSEERVESEIQDPRSTVAAAVHGQLTDDPQDGSAPDTNNDVIPPSCSKQAAPPPKSPDLDPSNTRGNEGVRSATEKRKSHPESIQHESADSKDVELSPEGNGGVPPLESSEYELDDKYELDDEVDNKAKTANPTSASRPLALFTRVADVIYESFDRLELDISPAPSSTSSSEGKSPLTSPPLFPRLPSSPDFSSAARLELGLEAPECMYDDIKVHRVQDRSLGKPKLLPKPISSIQLQDEDSGKHKEKALALNSWSREGTRSPGDSGVGLQTSEEPYNDITIHKIQNQPLGKPKTLPKPAGMQHRSEKTTKREVETKALAGKNGESPTLQDASKDLYDDIVVHRIPNKSPKLPPKPSNVEVPSDETSSEQDLKKLSLASKRIETLAPKVTSGDMYDDIAIHRVQDQSLSKPKLLHKPIDTQLETRKNTPSVTSSKESLTPGTSEDIAVHRIPFGKPKLLRKPIDTQLENRLKAPPAASSSKSLAPGTSNDDIAVHRIQNQPFGKPKLLRKPIETKVETRLKTPPAASSKESLAPGTSNDDIAVHRIQDRALKPEVRPKPANFQFLSESKKSAENLAPKTVSEDIYDDIIVHRLQNQSVGKSKLLPKPSGIEIGKLKRNLPRFSKSDENLASRKEVAAPNSVATVDSDVEEEHIYDHAVIKAMQKQTFTSFEDIDNNIIIHRLHHHSKPEVPRKPTSVLSHPKVVEMLRLKKWQQLQEIEEIYDLDPPEQPNNIESTDDEYAEEIYVDSTITEEHDDSSKPQNITPGTPVGH